MKRYRKTMVTAAVMALFAVQTVFAAPEDMSPANGPEAGAVVQVAPNPWAAGTEQTVSDQAETPDTAVPDGQSEQNISQQPGEQSGGQSTGLSPVIVAGGGSAQQPAGGTASQGQTAAPSAGDAPSENQQTAGDMPAENIQPAGDLAAEAGQPEANGQAGGQTTGETTETPQQSAGRTIDPTRPMVALTYDDGPQASVGNRIMDCLAQYGGKATFFLVGERVPSHAAEVQRMVNEGHEVANHTMNHKYLQKLGAAEIQSQVAQCNDVIEATCGVRPRLMRLPGGNSNATVKANTHMPMIQWNIDTLDWKTRNADKTVEAVLSKVQDGDIILMHELYSQTGDASLRIIPELANRGFQMVTVSEMAAAKGYNLQAGQLYSSMR